MVAKSANPKGLTNDCQVKWKNWSNSSIKAFFLCLKWQSNKPQNWANVVEAIMIIFTASKLWLEMVFFSITDFKWSSRGSSLPKKMWLLGKLLEMIVPVSSPPLIMHKKMPFLGAFTHTHTMFCIIWALWEGEIYTHPRKILIVKDLASSHLSFEWLFPSTSLILHVVSNFEQITMIKQTVK